MIRALLLLLATAASSAAQPSGEPIRLPPAVAAVVADYGREHPAYRFPAADEFDKVNLRYYRDELGYTDFDPYVVSGYLNADTLLDHAVLLAGPAHADDRGRASHDLRILIIEGGMKWEGPQLAEVLADMRLPYDRTGVARIGNTYTGIVNHGLTIWLAESDVLVRTEATSAGYLPNPDDGYDTPPAEDPLLVHPDSLRIDDPVYEYVVDAAVPVLSVQTTYGTRSQNADGIERVNRALARDIRSRIERFKPSEPQDTTLQCATCGDMAYVSGQMDVDLARQGVFSTLVTLHAYTGGAHGNDNLYAYTFDLRTGREIAAHDLFRPGSGWEQALARLARDGVAALRRERGIPASEARPSTQNRLLSRIASGDPLFTLGPDVLIVHFPPYSVGSFAEGTYHVPIPREAIASYLRPDIPPGW